MKTKRFYLKDLSEHFANSKAYFDYYEFANSDQPSSFKRPALVVVPGGGYHFVAIREGEPIALRFLCEGFTAFVLTYSVYTKYPGPHLELAFMMNYINEHSEEFKILKQSTSLVGFSAGGHLVGSYSYLYGELADMLSIKKEDIRPKSIILGYPVILLKKESNGNTMNNISNKEDDLIAKLTIEKHVGKDYPPTYIFTSKDDNLVPYQHTVIMDEMLTKAGVPHITRIFERGGHGGSLFTQGVFEGNKVIEEFKENREWPAEAADFMLNMLNKK